MEYDSYKDVKKAAGRGLIKHLRLLPIVDA
jgi:hypothetical protein